MLKCLSLLLIFFSSQIFAQQRIDGALDFNGNGKQKYAIYIPSTYNANVKSPLVLAVHPLIKKWDASTWRERLAKFSERNGVILLCPERRGNDLDADYFSLVLDSAVQWLNIDQNRIYGLGHFSFNENTYNQLRGTISLYFNASEELEVLQEVREKEKLPFVLLNSFRNQFNTSKLREGVKAEYIRNINPSLSFQYRDKILSEALNWLELQNVLPTGKKENKQASLPVASNAFTKNINQYKSNSNYSKEIEEVEITSIKWYTESFSRGQAIMVNAGGRIFSVAVYNRKGKLVRTVNDGSSFVRTNGWSSGSYIMKVNTSAGMETHVVRLN